MLLLLGNDRMLRLRILGFLLLTLPLSILATSCKTPSDGTATTKSSSLEDAKNKTTTCKNSATDADGIYHSITLAKLPPAIGDAIPYKTKSDRSIKVLFVQAQRCPLCYVIKGCLEPELASDKKVCTGSENTPVNVTILTKGAMDTNNKFAIESISLKMIPSPEATENETVELMNVCT